MFSLRNKKNIDTFWLKKVPYQELCAHVQADLGLCCCHMYQDPQFASQDSDSQIH